MTTAFLYKWTHIPTLNWYVGSRTARGCHPDDGYICSSKLVKPMILENKEEWYRHIIATGSPSEMIELESEILQLLDAKNDSRSFNQSNNDKKFSMSGKQKGPMSQRHKDKLSKSKKGRVAWNKGLTKETNEKVRLNGIRSGNTRKGKPGHSFTPEQRLKIGNTERLTKQNKKRICGAQELDTGITQQDRGLQEVLLRRTKC